MTALRCPVSSPIASHYSYCKAISKFKRAGALAGSQAAASTTNMPMPKQMASSCGWKTKAMADILEPYDVHCTIVAAAGVKPRGGHRGREENVDFLWGRRAARWTTATTCPARPS